MKVLIIGSEGFIGSNLVSAFLKVNWEVSGCDLFESPQKNIDYKYFKVSRLSPQWDEIFSANEFDVCVNAGGSGNVSYAMQYPLIDFESNTLDVVRLLDAIRKNSLRCRYLHISSAAVYGNPLSLPVSESSSQQPISSYGWHKLMSEQVCKEYYCIYKVETAIIRPFSVYGEGLKKQLFWDICQMLLKSSSIQLSGTGQESRDFIHVEDIGRLFVMLLRKGAFQGEVYNAASGVETKIQSIAEIVEQYFDMKKRIIFSRSTRPGDPLNWKADISSITSLGFSTSIELKEGVERYLRWFESYSNSQQ